MAFPPPTRHYSCISKSQADCHLPAWPGRQDIFEELGEEKTSCGRTLHEYIDASSRPAKFIFPSAHHRYSTFWQEEQTEWFDIWSLDRPDERQDLQIGGLVESIHHVRGIMDDEIRSGTAPGDIFLAGISQAYAIALHILLSQPHRLSGLIGLSGWLPFSKDLTAIDAQDPIPEIRQFYAEKLAIGAHHTSPETLLTPISAAHCEDDNVVEIRHGVRARDTPRKLGFNVEWKAYSGGGHWINETAGLDDIVTFIEQGERV